MRLPLLVGALLLIASSVQADEYTLMDNVWTCKAPGALLDLEAHNNDQAADPKISAEIDKARCMPTFSPMKVKVSAFQGRYAFVCEDVASAMGNITDCSYALTQDLRDARGKRVPDQVSKGSSPLK